MLVNTMKKYILSRFLTFLLRSAICSCEFKDVFLFSIFSFYTPRQTAHAGLFYQLVLQSTSVSNCRFGSYFLSIFEAHRIFSFTIKVILFFVLIFIFHHDSALFFSRTAVFVDFYDYCLRFIGEVYVGGSTRFACACLPPQALQKCSVDESCRGH